MSKPISSNHHQYSSTYVTYHLSEFHQMTSQQSASQLNSAALPTLSQLNVKESAAESTLASSPSSLRAFVSHVRLKQKHLPESVAAKLFDTIAQQKAEWEEFLKESGSDFLYLPRDNDKFPRSIFCTKHSTFFKVFIIFSQVLQGDVKIGSGSFKVGTMALEFHSAKWFASFQMPDEAEAKLEIGNHKFVEGIKGFQPLEAHFVYPTKSGQPVYRLFKEYYPENLFQFINRTEKISSRDVEGILSQIFRAVIAAHDKGVLHRDLTMTNILINRHKTIEITDFGSVADLSKAKSRLQLRTNAYWAPPEYAAAFIANQDLDAQLYEANALIEEETKAKRSAEFAEQTRHDIIQKQIKLALSVNKKELDMWSLGCVVHYVLFRQLPLWCVVPKDGNLSEHNVIPLMNEEFKKMKRNKSWCPELGLKKSIFHILWRLLKLEPKERMTAVELGAAMKDGITYTDVVR